MKPDGAEEGQARGMSRAEEFAQITAPFHAPFRLAFTHEAFEDQNLVNKVHTWLLPYVEYYSRNIPRPTSPIMIRFPESPSQPSFRMSRNAQRSVA